MRKICCDKFGNVQFYFPENPDICLHPREDVVFKVQIPLCGQTKRSAKLLTFTALSCLPTTGSSLYIHTEEPTGQSKLCKMNGFKYWHLCVHRILIIFIVIKVLEVQMACDNLTQRL